MENEKKKKKRKLRWQIKLILVIIIFTLYIFFIGTKGIFIEEFKIETNKISKETSGLKITQISDIHYGSTVNDKTLKNIIKKVNLTKPDIVIFTGDLINKDYALTNEEKQTIIKELKKIKSKLGNYFILGEEDNKETINILNLSNFTYLSEKEQLVYSNSNVPILLADKDNIKTYIEENKDSNIFKLLVLHNPNDINKLKTLNIDMAIAGHTHDGQISIPKLKELFINSKYINNQQKVNNIELYINPGIGTSVINARLFNHPTIYLYRINKAS